MCLCHTAFVCVHFPLLATSYRFCMRNTNKRRTTAMSAGDNRKTFNPEAILLNDAEPNITISVAAAVQQQQHHHHQSYNNTWTMIKWRYFFWQLYNRWFRFVNALRPKTKPHSNTHTYVRTQYVMRSPHTYTYTYTYKYRQSIGKNGAMRNTCVCSVYGTVLLRIQNHAHALSICTCLKCSLCERSYTHKSLQQLL